MTADLAERRAAIFAKFLAEAETVRHDRNRLQLLLDHERAENRRLRAQIQQLTEGDTSHA